MSERLEVMVTELSMTAWLKAIVDHVAALDASAFAAAMQTFRAPVPTAEAVTPLEAELQRGVRGVASGLAVLDFDDARSKAGEERDRAEADRYVAGRTAIAEHDGPG